MLFLLFIIFKLFIIFIIESTININVIEIKIKILVISMDCLKRLPVILTGLNLSGLSKLQTLIICYSRINIMNHYIIYLYYTLYSLVKFNRYGKFIEKNYCVYIYIYYRSKYWVNFQFVCILVYFHTLMIMCITIFIKGRRLIIITYNLYLTLINNIFASLCGINVL